MGRIVGITYTNVKPADDEQKQVNNADTAGDIQPSPLADQPVIPGEEPEEMPEEPETKAAKRAGRK